MVGGVVLAAYLCVVIASNWLIAAFGSVPVGFGLVAPAGVYAVGPTLVLRSLLQLRLGRRVALAAVVVGSVASYWVATAAVASASVAAFFVSELTDYIVFSWLGARSTGAVLAGAVAGLVVDSAVFLAVAFGSWEMLPGQLLGKVYGVLVSTVFLAVGRWLGGATR